MAMALGVWGIYYTCFRVRVVLMNPYNCLTTAKAMLCCSCEHVWVFNVSATIDRQDVGFATACPLLGFPKFLVTS